MSRRIIDEIELSNEVFDIADEEARNLIEKYHNKKWFFINDSYGVSSVSDDPFPTQLLNAGLIEDELSVGMMSYNGTTVNVIPQLQTKLSQMSQDTIDSITDIVCTIGLNDTWDNYNLISLDSAVRTFISFVTNNFKNMNCLHLAPIGNEVDKSGDNENQANRMKMVQHVIKKCVGTNSKVCFVDNSQIAMNCPAYFKSDGVHPNSEGSEMLTNNFTSYMKNNNFPLNTYSYLYPLDQFGWRYRVEYVGASCSGEFQWDSDVAQFSVVGTNDFDIIFSGLVELPLMRKLELNPSIIATDTGSNIKQGLLGLIGLTPSTSTHSGLILSGHANTGGNTPEYYNHVKFFTSFSCTI